MTPLTRCTPARPSPSPTPAGSPHYRSGWDDGLEAAIDAARAALLDHLPLGDEYEHVWVTALDGNDEPARDADGRTWTHCGVCGNPRTDPARPLPLSTPCAKPECGHPLNWHTGEHGCITRGGACSCPAFQPPTATAEARPC